MKPNAPFANEPQIVRTPALRGRVMRKPAHSWVVEQRPYRLAPILIAPIMAGDTLKSLSYQARAITDPVWSPLRGWFHETWFFFVRVIDMRDGEAIMEDLIDETQAPRAPETPIPGRYFGYGTDYLTRAMENILPLYFRDYGKAWNEVMEGDLPVVQVRKHGWLENYVETSTLPADDSDAEDFENLWTKWSVLSRSRLTTATYEEFLRTQGVTPPKRLREPDLDLKVPELVLYQRDFQFPIATIAPTTGVASSAVSWALSGRAQRARRFTEPGFIVGFTCVRPKEYLPRAAGSSDTLSSVFQTGYASGMLNTAKSWIPPVYQDEPGESLRSFSAYAADNGPVGQSGTTYGYTIDQRDLWLNGDQMICAASISGLPVYRRAGALWKYPTEAAVTRQFAGEDPAGLVRHEGMATLHIAGRVRRTTA